MLAGLDLTQAPHTPSTFLNQTVWVFGSFAVISLAGATLTFWLAAFVGPKALGIFNQLYALYIILGQLFVIGLNDSTLKFSAQHRENGEELEPALGCALLTATVAGLAGSLLTYAFARPLAYVMDSDPVGDGIVFIAPALFLFVINKVLASYVNGVQRMRYYAVAQSLRGVLLVILIVAITTNGYALSYFGLAFVGAEVGVLLIFVPVLAQCLRSRFSLATLRRWIRTHCAFGLRALPHGLLSESFFRIDILVLAVFLSDADVGIYSFVAFFIEGLLQIPYIVRVVTTPRLVAIMEDRDLSALRLQALKSIPSSAAAAALAAGFLVLVFPLIQTWFPLVEDPRSLTILKILLIGVCAYAFFAPFENIFLSAGRPDLQSLFMVIITASNVALNFILIPQYGLSGAAAATTITFFVSSLALNLIAFSVFRIHRW